MRSRLLVVLAAVGACSEPEPAGPDLTSGVVKLEIPVATNRRVDVLFVIDNSPAMAPHQSKLAAAYRDSIDFFETGFARGMPDLHLAVVTTDLGTRGAGEASGPAIGAGPGACSSDGDRGELRRTASGARFLSDIARPHGERRERNYSGSLADAFAQLADVGAAGCTYARPLEAVRRALASPVNEGFRRPHAYLAIVFLTAGDDCSFESSAFTGGDLDRSKCAASPGGLVALDEYAAAVEAAEPLRGAIVLGGFARPDAPACTGVAPAPRLAAFAERFLDGAAVSMCAPDLAGVVAPLRDFELVTLGAPCFGEPLFDADPETAGLQPDCAAWYTYRDRGGAFEQIVPACQGDEPGPCYRLESQSLTCAGFGEMFVLRDPLQGFEPGADPLVHVECVAR